MQIKTSNSLRVQREELSLVALQSGLITDLIIDHKQGPYTDHSI